MRRSSKQIVSVSVVALLILLAGCGGGGGGDGGADTPTTTTTPAATTAVPTTTTSGSSSTTRTETTTTEPSPTPTTTESRAAFDPAAHTAALQEANSFTVKFTIKAPSGESSTTTIRGTQKHILDTGEMYLSLETTSDGETTTIKYYRPPNSDTVYQRIAGQTREVSDVQGFSFNFSDPGTGTETETWPEFTREGTGSTALGPATTYVVDSVDELPESTTSQYNNITDVQFTIWVDKDTGVIAKYNYRITYVENGQEKTIEVTYEITKLGSTTIERPSWA